VIRVGAVVLASGALCAACGATSHTATVEKPPPLPYRGFAIKPPVAAPKFRLRDQDSRLVGPAAARGKWLVVTFLYTHCPDVCPLIADNLAAAQRALPNLWVLAVSVDPKGDKPAAVRGFIRRHHLTARFRYLTGSRAQLAPVWASYHVAAVGGPNAIVSHSSFEVLVDQQGRERLLYDAQLRAADLIHDIRKLA